MATVTPITRHLQLQFQVGTTAKGETKLQNRNFAHVSPSASDDDLLAVGQALAGLINESLYQVARVDQSGIAAATVPTA